MNRRGEIEPALVAAEPTGLIHRFECGCEHRECPCEELSCPYGGVTCDLCSMHANAEELIEAAEYLLISWESNLTEAASKLQRAVNTARAT